MSFIMKEFKHGESVQIKGAENWHCRVYIGTHQNRHVVGSPRGGTYACDDDEIRKEAPSSVDVEIDSFNGLGFPIIDGMIIYEYQESKSGEVLSGYLIDGHDEVYREPILFNTNGTEIEHKATHARFVKIN